MSSSSSSAAAPPLPDCNQLIANLIHAVRDALLHLKEQTGSTSASIKKFMLSHCHTTFPYDLAPFITAALKEGTKESNRMFVQSGRRWKIYIPPPPPPSPSMILNLAMNMVATGKTKMYKVKRTLKIRKLFKSYSQQIDVPIERLKFFLNGIRLSAVGSVEKQSLNDCDEIDVYIVRARPTPMLSPA